MADDRGLPALHPKGLAAVGRFLSSLRARVASPRVKVASSRKKLAPPRKVFAPVKMFFASLRVKVASSRKSFASPCKVFAPVKVSCASPGVKLASLRKLFASYPARVPPTALLLPWFLGGFPSIWLLTVARLRRKVLLTTLLGSTTSWRVVDPRSL